MIGSLIIVPDLSTLLQLGCHDPLQHDEFLLHLIFYFIMFGFYLLEVCSFLISDRKGVDAEKRSGEELGEVGGRGKHNQGMLHEKGIYLEYKRLLHQAIMC